MKKDSYVLKNIRIGDNFICISSLNNICKQKEIWEIEEIISPPSRKEHIVRTDNVIKLPDNLYIIKPQSRKSLAILISYSILKENFINKDQ